MRIYRLFVFKIFNPIPAIVTVAAKDKKELNTALLKGLNGNMLAINGKNGMTYMYDRNYIKKIIIKEVSSK